MVSVIPDPQAFLPGDLVWYIPCHANGDETHPDVEMGEVIRVMKDIVFVQFGGSGNPQACSPWSLKLCVRESEARR